MFPADEHAGEDGSNENNAVSVIAPSNSESANSPSDNFSSILRARSSSVQTELGFSAPVKQREVRLYTSESRIWQTITGHEPDFTRIPSLDFVCLSIIAACGPKGIAQNDLIRISGQDKRSLPMRTDRLQKGGYIIKRPVSIVHNKVIMHTSLLTLKRFAESSEATATELTEAARQKRKGRKGKSKGSCLDAGALAPEESPSRPEVFSEEMNRNDNEGSLEGQQTTKPPAQWTPDRNIVNQIFDVVRQSGLDGTTLSDISCQLMGPCYRRPIEDLLAKLSSSWQLSQPLHLRHLAIVKDSVQKGKNMVYMYYTFEHYEKLVEAGQKTWEAVLMLQDEEQNGHIRRASVDTQPELDVYNLPKLHPGQFQSHDIDASLSECVPAGGTSLRPIRPISMEISKNSTKKGNRATIMQTAPATTTGATPAVSKASIGRVVNASDGRRSNSIAVKRGRGRPRKYQNTGVPANIAAWDVDEVKALIESRRMSDKYQKLKITDEIKRRMEEGEDPRIFTHQLLEATDEIRKGQGEGPMSRILVMQILHEYAGGAEPPEEDDVITTLRNMLKEAGHVRYPQGKWPRLGRPPKDLSLEEKNRPIDPSENTRPITLEGTRARRPPKAYDESPIPQDANIKRPRMKNSVKPTTVSSPYWHLPSVAAHSRIQFPTLYANTKLRAPPANLPYWHLPSVAAHSKPHHIMQQAVIAGSQTWHKTGNKKRERPPKRADADAESTVETPTKQRKVTSSKDNEAINMTTPLPSSPATGNVTEEILRPSTPADKSSLWTVHKIMAEKYAKAVESITCLGQGVFMSKVAQRYKRRDDPASMTTKSYQMAIFKLAALQDLAWFVDKKLVAQSGGSTYDQRQKQTDIAQVRPRSENIIHKGPLLQTRPESLEPSSAACVLSSSAPSTQTGKDGVAPAETVRDKAPSSLLAGHSMNPGSRAIFPDDCGNICFPSNRRQDPANYVFKFPKLKTLGWFPHDLSVDDGETPGLSDAQISVPAPCDKLHQAPIRDASRSEASQDNAPSIEEDSVGFTNRLPIPAKGRGSGKSGRNRGSTAILRRDIIIHLVQKCGGVFPEAGAMRAPFAREWKARGQPGIPDRNTIINAVNICCEQGKLRRIVFSFKDRYGVTATSTVLALPEIDSNDRKIEETQEMIRQCHPQTFMPEALMPKEPDMADLRIFKRQQLLREAADKKVRVEEAKAMASKSQEDREAYIATLQSSDRSEQEIATLSRLAQPSTHKIQRLATIRKPSIPFLSSDASMDVQAHETQPRGPFVELSQDRALSRGISKTSGPTPTTSSPYDIIHSSRSSKARYDEFLVQSEQSRHRNRELANQAAQIERNQAAKNFDSPFLEHRNFGQSLSTPNEYAASHDISSMDGKHAASGMLSAGSPDYPFDDVVLRPFVGGRKRKRFEGDESVFPGFMDPIHTYHRTTGTFAASFPGFRIGTLKLNQRGRRKYNQKATIPLGYQSPFPLRTDWDEESLPLPQSDYGSYVFPGVVAPDVFYSSSGTFSSTFLGFKVLVTQTTKARALRKRQRRKSQNFQTAADAEDLATYENSSRRHTKRRRESTIESDPKDVAVIENLSRRNTKRRRRQFTTESNAFDGSAEPSNPLIGSPVRLRRVRGPQTTSTMGENGALRLFVAVTVVRVLTGGLRRTIDWALVAKVFAPEYDEAFIRSKWSSVLAKMRHHQVRMDADFQTLFGRAYEEDVVPKIDFERLDEYNWKWLVEWTMTHLDTPANSAPELLQDRSAFEQSYALNDTSQEKDLAHFFEFEGFSVKDLRTSVINRQAYGCFLFPEYLSNSKGYLWTESEEEQVAIAYSWIRANILTPAETYDSQAARVKLNTLSTPVVEAALNSLLQEKVVVEKYKNRAVPGRDYEISDFFGKRLRTNISPAQFYHAVAFKSQFDQAIETEGRARWSQLASDGDAMAVLNLLANQRIKIVPIDPPLNEWGHTDDGYATRQMDKSKLNFEVDIIPTSEYIKGNPLEPLPPPPAPHLNASDDQLRKIPVWYDINDDLVPGMWAPVLASVLGLLAVRTGANAAELQVNVRPSLQIWEVEEVLQWMVKADVAGQIGSKGYRVKEWWWMALGGGSHKDFVKSGYKQGLATKMNKPKTSRRRYHKAEGKEKERLESFTGNGTPSQDTGETFQARMRDEMEIG